MPGLEPDNAVTTKLNRLSEIARQNPKATFTSLAHLLNVEFLTECYYELNVHAAAGIDQETYQTYGENLPANLEELVERLKSKRYRATDIRRVWIPKPDGGQRPLGILVLEDKIVQKGVAKILSAIYEQDFLDGSYGFRPHRNAHDALKAVELSIIQGEVNYLWDVDIRGYFDNIDKGWLMRMLRDLYQHLCRILRGYYNYYGFAGNSATLDQYHYVVRRLWFKWLNRRSQRKSFTWKEFLELIRRYPLPEPRIYQGYAWI